VSTSCLPFKVHAEWDVIKANATEEFFVRRRPLYEVVGMMGFWGLIINGAQAAGLESKSWKDMTWNGPNSEIFVYLTIAGLCAHGDSVVGLLIAYTAGNIPPHNQSQHVC
jgi:hypothetical protein